MASGNSGITIGSGLPRLAGGRRTGSALAEREAARIARSSARFRSRSMRPKVQRIDAALISGRKEVAGVREKLMRRLHGNATLHHGISVTSHAAPMQGPKGIFARASTIRFGTAPSLARSAYRIVKATRNSENTNEFSIPSQ